MHDDRLILLSILSIEGDVLDSLSFDEIKHNFA